MIDDRVLLDDWHAVARSSELRAGEVHGARLLGIDLVLWRSEQGLCAWQDLCVHRGTRLSRGTIQSDCLVCPYHGWTYDASARCVRIPAHPSQPPPARARATAYALREEYGLVWVCLGTAKEGVPDFSEWSDDSFRKVSAGP
jgi:phenylpropionate dioxygenase-like ring-hydroxylating dioxygenase large terminal subunit